MRSSIFKKSVLTVGLMIAGSAWAGYEIIDLGTLGGTGSTAYGLNNNAEVVGLAHIVTNSTSHAYLYNGVMVDLHSSLGVSNSSSQAHDINDNGLIVGRFIKVLAGVNYSHAFLHDHGVVTDLNALLGANESLANAVNNDGNVVGQYYDSSNISRAYLYNSTTGFITYPGALGGIQSWANGINENGDVVGAAQTSGGSMHGFSYINGVMADVGTLGGSTSHALGINDSETIVGFSYVSGDSAARAFIYSAGLMTDIGTLGGANSGAMAINSSGDVVGYSGVAPGSGGALTRAFLYSGGVMQDLNSLLPPASGWELVSAYGINDNGVIVGHGTINGIGHAYMMTPGC